MTGTQLKINTFLDWKNQKPKVVTKIWNNEYKGCKIKAESTNEELLEMVEKTKRIKEKQLN